MLLHCSAVDRVRADDPACRISADENDRPIAFQVARAYQRDTGELRVGHIGHVVVFAPVGGRPGPPNAVHLPASVDGV